MFVLLLALVWPTEAKPKDVAADQLAAQWHSLRLLRADPTRYRVITEPFTIADGPVSLTVDSGLLVPIFSGHTPNDRDALGKIRLESWADEGVAPERGSRGNVAFVGFVWVAGTGSVTVDWTERADHQIFANHLVRNLGADREALAEVARGAPWTSEATEAVVLSVDPQIQDLFLGPDDVSHDPLEVVVYGERTRPGALARAKSLLQRRVNLLAAQGIEVQDWVAQDRVLVARGRRELGAHALIDVRTTASLGAIHLGPDDQPTAVDWLTLLRDETGATDTRRHTGVWVIDETARGPFSWRMTGVPFPPSDPNNPLSPPLAPWRLDAEDAYVIAMVVDSGASADVEAVARLKLRAVGGVIDSFDLNVPRAGTEAAFEVLSATRDDRVSLLSATPMVDHNAVLSPWKPDRGGDGGDTTGEADPGGDDVPDPSKKRDKAVRTTQVDPYHDRPETRITLVPPEPLQPGEALIIDIRWKDRWPLSNIEVVDVANPDGAGGSMIIDHGGGSGRQSLLPRLPGAPEGNPSKFTIKLAAQDRPYMRAAVSGELKKQYIEAEVFLVTESSNTAQRVPFADVAVGAFHVHDEAVEGYPNVRTRMRSALNSASIASETRRQIRFFEGYLPPYPWPEHEVMQSPGLFNGWLWVASHELTSVMKSQATSMMAGAKLARADGRQTGQRVLSHELAHQWWGHLVRPAHTEDFWFAETFAESMARMYMGAVHGNYDSDMARKRELWEDWEDLHIPRASLTSAYRSPHQPDIVYQYGPYVFQEMLRKRIGHVPYHAALDLLQRDFAHQPVTTEQIQDYFERASERDLDDFFDFWVHAGFLPEKLRLDWAHSGGTFAALVRSDVPFGTFDVEIQIDGERHWVDVIDGVGRLELPMEAEPQVVELDPRFTVIARKRAARRGDPGEAVD